MTRLKTLLFTGVFLLCPLGLLANTDGKGSGTVAETISVGGYVYVQLAEDGTWVAAKPIPVSKGDQVSYAGGAMMKDFYSSSLDRTFETVWFVSSLEVTQSGDPNPHAGIGGGFSQATAAEPMTESITPVAGGKTIAEVYAQVAELKDQQVSLRGRVIKFSPNILGKNWVTLQDGTGTAPQDKLIVTSANEVEIGDLVTATGTIRNNVDLGSGYTYKVILAEATFAQQ
jgi:hypothetical protein